MKKTNLLILSVVGVASIGCVAVPAPTYSYNQPRVETNYQYSSPAYEEPQPQIIKQYIHTPPPPQPIVRQYIHDCPPPRPVVRQYNYTPRYYTTPSYPVGGVTSFNYRSKNWGISAQNYY